MEQNEGYLKTQWPKIREKLLNGQYRRKAVRRVEISKPGGRDAGIGNTNGGGPADPANHFACPAANDRLTFSEFSFGFRPGQSAHDAVRKAQSYVQEGYQIVVDIDLEKFFDRLNHDILMGRLAKRISDKRDLRVMRRYLQAGIMENGVVMKGREGMPEGSPLPRSWRTSSWMTWTRNWKEEDTDLRAMPTTATSTSEANVQGNGFFTH